MHGSSPLLFYWPIIIDPLLALVCVCVGMSFKIYTATHSCVSCIYILCTRNVVGFDSYGILMCIRIHPPVLSIISQLQPVCVCMCLVYVGCVWQRFKSDSESFAVSRYQGESRSASRRRRRGIRTRRLTKQCRNSAAKAVNKVTTQIHARPSIASCQGIDSLSLSLCCVLLCVCVGCDPGTFISRSQHPPISSISPVSSLLFFSFRRPVVISPWPQRFSKAFSTRTHTHTQRENLTHLMNRQRYVCGC